MNKLMTMTAAALLFAFPAFGQTILALNAAGPINQLNAVTVQASEANTAGIFVGFNDIDSQALGNGASVSQTNNLSFLTANAQGGVNQANVATAQLSRANTLGLIVVANDIDTNAIGNLATVTQENDLSLGVVNLQAGINQVNFVSLQASQANTVGAVVAGNAITSVAAGNVGSIGQTN